MTLIVLLDHIVTEKAFGLTSFWGQFCTYVQCTVTMFGEVSSACLTVCGQTLFVPWSLPWILHSVPFYLCFIFDCIFILAMNQLKWLLMNSLSFSSKLVNLKVVLGLPSLQSVLEVGFTGSIIWEEEGWEYRAGGAFDLVLAADFQNPCLILCPRLPEIWGSL